MTAVQAPAGRFREALAELPLSARRVEGPGGAVVVVPGDVGWVDGALDAASAGAIAVIVSRPAFASTVDIRRIMDALDVPVVVERTLLRPDSAEDAAAHRLTDPGWATPRLVAVDGIAPRGLVPVVARDAAGWLRTLVGTDLGLIAADGVLALLETGGGIAATLSVVATSRPGHGSIRVRALGEVRTEIEVEGDRTRIRTSTARGSLSAPDRFESSARLALRRAIAALDAGDVTDDLGRLAADTELVERILSAAS